MEFKALWTKEDERKYREWERLNDKLLFRFMIRFLRYTSLSRLCAPDVILESEYELLTEAMIDAKVDPSKMKQVFKMIPLYERREKAYEDWREQNCDQCVHQFGSDDEELGPITRFCKQYDFKEVPFCDQFCPLKKTE